MLDIQCILTIFLESIVELNIYASNYFLNSEDSMIFVILMRLKYLRFIYLPTLRFSLLSIHIYLVSLMVLVPLPGNSGINDTTNN
jgi:hypothetical protein